MASASHLIRIELPSSFELLDLVQLLSDRLSLIAGLDEDAVHWVSVAVRESVINAIKHGNRGDRRKHVHIEFMLTPRERPTQFVVEVLDDGSADKSLESASGRRLEAPDQPDGRSGHGIVGMRERALLLGGTLEARPRPSGGFRVVAHLPTRGEPA